MFPMLLFNFQYILNARATASPLCACDQVWEAVSCDYYVCVQDPLVNATALR